MQSSSYQVICQLIYLIGVYIGHCKGNTKMALIVYSQFLPS